MNELNYNKKDSPIGAINSLLSPLINSLDEKCTDFIINPNRKAFCYLSNGDCFEVRNNLPSSSEIETLAYLLAGELREDLTEDFPGVSARILTPRRARLEIIIPPAVEEPCLSMRFYTFNNVTLQNLRDANMFTLSQMNKMKNLITHKYNIIISGATGSGKTTLLTALVNEIDRSERLVIIEDLPEIECTLPNFTRLTTALQGFDGTQAIIRTLRMRPDRIIYGEVRTSAAFDLLDAWNTGHEGGLGTIHASSSDEALTRLSKLASRKASTISYEICSSLASSSVDCVIQLEQVKGQRRIKEIKIFHDKG